jgi:hypothetical protein
VTHLFLERSSVFNFAWRNWARVFGISMIEDFLCWSSCAAAVLYIPVLRDVKRLLSMFIEAGLLGMYDAGQIYCDVLEDLW